MMNMNTSNTNNTNNNNNNLSYVSNNDTTCYDTTYYEDMIGLSATRCLAIIKSNLKNMYTYNICLLT